MTAQPWYRTLLEIGDKLDAAMHRRALLWLGLVVAGCMGFATWESATRPFWYDEIMTDWISRLPVIPDLFKVLAVDAHPPLSFVVVKIFRAVLGESELAVRLPSILCCASAGICVFLFMSRRCSTLQSLFSVAMLFGSFASYYASEARPYAFVLGFLALALLNWQRAADALEEGRSRTWPLVGLAVGIGGAVLSHHYATLQLALPLGLGEAVRLWKRRRIDWGMAAAMAAGLSMLAISLPLAWAAWHTMLRYTSSNPNFLFQPEWSQLWSFDTMYPAALKTAGAVLPVMAVAALLRYADRKTPSPPTMLLPHELAASIGLTLILPVMVTFILFTSKYFLNRYAVGTVLGVAILAGQALSLLGTAKNFAAFLLFVNALIGGQAVVVKRSWRIMTLVQPLDIAQLRASSEPLVFGNTLGYIPTFWYASPTLRSRLHYLSDLDYAIKQPDFVAEVALVEDRDFIPAKVDDYNQFVAANRSFLVAGEGWLVPRLHKEGWKFKLLGVSQYGAVSRATAPELNPGVQPPDIKSPDLKPPGVKPH